MSNTPTPKFYSSIGFHANPFEGNTAEREPEIEHYAVRPPYLDPVEAASKGTGSYTLSGTRGSGKSATRITVQRNMWNDDALHPLPISLVNFTPFRGKRSSRELLELFADQVFFLTIEACLVHSTTAIDKSIEKRLDSLQKNDKHFFDWALKNYYLNRPESARTASAQECCDAFSLSLARKSKLWADKKWDSITGSLIQLSASIAKRFDVDVGDTSTFKDVLTSKKETGGSDPLYVLKKCVEFSRLMGFGSLLVQVDKIDETDWTTNDAEAAAKLIWPLYSNVQLHEIEGLSWSIFLWDRVRSLLIGENDMPVRWDKLPNDVIKWDRRHLERLVEARLEHFSDKKIKKLGELFEEKIINEDIIYSQLFSLAGIAPRTLITVLNSVMTNHIQTNEGIGTKLTMESLNDGLNKYAVASILDDYSVGTIGQLKKVGSTSFVTKDVAKIFTISIPGALQKIEKWINSGLVRRDGQRFAGERTKPVDQFVVSEPRAKRIIEMKLELASNI